MLTANSDDDQPLVEKGDFEDGIVVLTPGNKVSPPKWPGDGPRAYLGIAFFKQPFTIRHKFPGGKVGQNRCRGSTDSGDGVKLHSQSVIDYLAGGPAGQGRRLTGFVRHLTKYHVRKTPKDA